MHRIPEPPGPDVCDHCGRELGAAIDGMFRMQNVSTHRVDRISSDEEERQRFGFELQSGVRFADRAKTRSTVEAEAIVDGEPWARLTYGDTATIWRINLGWRRRHNRDQHGFLIDLDRGLWQRNEDDDTDRDDPDATPRHRIIPYVEDSRNALLVHPTRRLELEEMASFAAALKHAVQRRYHLEDAELAVESLPDDADRRTLLLYEASEGGAGVLRQFAEEPDAFAGVVRTALEVCHYDPDTCVDTGGQPSMVRRSRRLRWGAVRGSLLRPSAESGTARPPSSSTGQAARDGSSAARRRGPPNETPGAGGHARGIRPGGSGSTSRAAATGSPRTPRC